MRERGEEGWLLPSGLWKKTNYVPQQSNVSIISFHLRPLLCVVVLRFRLQPLRSPVRQEVHLVEGGALQPIGDARVVQGRSLPGGNGFLPPEEKQLLLIKGGRDKIYFPPVELRKGMPQDLWGGRCRLSAWEKPKNAEKRNNKKSNIFFNPLPHLVYHLLHVFAPPANLISGWSQQRAKRTSPSLVEEWAATGAVRATPTPVKGCFGGGGGLEKEHGNF